MVSGLKLIKKAQDLRHSHVISEKEYVRIGNRIAKRGHLMRGVRTETLLVGYSPVIGVYRGNKLIGDASTGEINIFKRKRR